MNIKDQIKSFLALMHENRNFGAIDTEPRQAFYSLLESSFAGKDLDEDMEPDFWQLYSSMEGSEEVANEFTAKYKQLHYAIQEAPHKQIIEAANYFGLEY